MIDLVVAQRIRSVIIDARSAFSEHVARGMASSMTSFLLEPSATRPGLIVAVHTTSAPSDDEWSEWCEHCELGFSLVKGELSLLPGLAFSDGGAPTLAQRNRVGALVFDGRSKPRIAIVSGSTTIRLLGPVLGALMPGVRAFAPAAVRDAIAHCGWNASDADMILTLAEQRAERAFGAVPQALTSARASLRASPR